jgi:hypothetical protein
MSYAATRSRGSFRKAGSGPRPRSRGSSWEAESGPRNPEEPRLLSPPARSKAGSGPRPRNRVSGRNPVSKLTCSGHLLTGFLGYDCEAGIQGQVWATTEKPGFFLGSQIWATQPRRTPASELTYQRRNPASKTQRDAFSSRKIPATDPRMVGSHAAINGDRKPVSPMALVINDSR